jgi:hypothetical protein
MKTHSFGPFSPGRSQMSKNTLGRGSLEPTKPPVPPFEVDCDVRFDSAANCQRCIVRRLNFQAIPDGDYTLYIDHEDVSEILQLTCLHGGWYPLDTRRFSRHCA